MLPEPFRGEDIGNFLTMAAAEQWVSERCELDFLLSEFPGGCFCVRESTGPAVGFVTSLPHERGGWIGNLLVRPDCRGAGIGKALFLRAVGALLDAGVETIWLTASGMGRHLYEKHGFKSIDKIMRWVGKGTGTADGLESDDALRFDASLDGLCWGDRRESLLTWVAGRGTVIAQNSACAVVQPSCAGSQIGPFVALNRDGALRVITRALSTIATSTEVVCDASASNYACASVFRKAGFSIRSETLLMYAGAKPDYRPEYLYGLATMGSCG